jgi:hypothetical protein
LKFIRDQLFSDAYNQQVELERKHQNKIRSSGVSQISEIIKSVVRQKKKIRKESAQFRKSNEGNAEAGSYSKMTSLNPMDEDMSSEEELDDKGD